MSTQTLALSRRRQWDRERLAFRLAHVAHLRAVGRRALGLVTEPHAMLGPRAGVRGSGQVFSRASAASMRSTATSAIRLVGSELRSAVFYIGCLSRRPTDRFIADGSTIGGYRAATSMMLRIQRLPIRIGHRAPVVAPPQCAPARPRVLVTFRAMQTAASARSNSSRRLRPYCRRSACSWASRRLRLYFSSNTQARPRQMAARSYVPDSSRALRQRHHPHAQEDAVQHGTVRVFVLS